MRAKRILECIKHSRTNQSKKGDNPGVFNVGAASLIPEEGKKRAADIFSSDRTGGNGSKLCQGKFRLGITEYLFTVVKNWTRFPRSMAQTCP